MATTLLNQRRAAINSLKDKLREMDARRFPGKFSRLSATLRRMERDLERHSPKPIAEPEEQTVVSGLTGKQWGMVFEIENAEHGCEAKANFNQEAWLSKTFKDEDTRTDPDERALLLEEREATRTKP